MKTILLIDDHALFRCGIAMMLSAGLEHVDILQTASLEETLSLQVAAPHLLLLDIRLQGLSGLEGITLLKQKWPTARIAMLSAFDLPATISEAVERGALAFIAKTETPERLLLQVGTLLNSNPPASAVSGEIGARPKLTPRQRDVLTLLCQGLSNKAIGRHMGLSEHTVRGHVQAILAALQVSSRSEAIFASHRLGLTL
ncbi:response regulator [Kushneria aurantia]|uniref:Response regulator n=1 Tax=Kushneria aurantia TaxID=504092 RepID=A0ABV6FYT6_9GAMM|nr:response regulator transcription factor [Kushneria aurantia]